MAIQCTEALAGSYDSESSPGMERDAYGVFGEDSGLEGPDAGGFGFGDESGEERGTDSATTRGLCDVNADVGDAGVDVSAGNSAERGPTESFEAVDRDETTVWQMTFVPIGPPRSGLLEGSVGGGDAFEIDGAHLVPVIGGERGDRDHELMIMKGRCGSCADLLGYIRNHREGIPTPAG